MNIKQNLSKIFIYSAILLWAIDLALNTTFLPYIFLSLIFLGLLIAVISGKRPRWIYILMLLISLAAVIITFTGYGKV